MKHIFQKLSFFLQKRSGDDGDNNVWLGKGWRRRFVRIGGGGAMGLCACLITFPTPSFCQTDVLQTNNIFSNAKCFLMPKHNMSSYQVLEL